MLHAMKNEIQSTIAPYIGAIVDDVVTLGRQELALLKSEAREELDKVRRAAWSFAFAVGLGTASTLLFSMALVTALTQYVPEVPVWGWYLVVAGVVSLAGFIFLRRAKVLASSVAMPTQNKDSKKENSLWKQHDA